MLELLVWVVSWTLQVQDKDTLLLQLQAEYQGTADGVLACFFHSLWKRYKSRWSSCHDPVLFVVWFCNCKDVVHSSSCNWGHNCPVQDGVYNQIQLASSLNLFRHLNIKNSFTSTEWKPNPIALTKARDFSPYLTCSALHCIASLHNHASQHLSNLKSHYRFCL